MTSQLYILAQFRRIDPAARKILDRKCNAQRGAPGRLNIMNLALGKPDMLAKLGKGHSQFHAQRPNGAGSGGRKLF